MFLTACYALFLALLGVFLLHFLCMSWSFVHREPTGCGDPGAFRWHFFVPCRDEETVVGATVTEVREHFPDSHVWVIDDDSHDATGAIVAELAARDPQVHVVQRRRPHARSGKGAALNAAYAALSAHLERPTEPGGANGYPDRSRTVVCVLDADGHLSPDALSHVSGSGGFADPRVGGVQVSVRMHNVDDPRPLPSHGRLVNALARSLVRAQDMEFRTIGVGMQLLRTRTGSVGLGGNGQFTRLTALDDVARRQGGPWRRHTLVEDYELSMNLLLAGHRITHVADTWVAQEALPRLRRLLTQRTRWAQGSLQCTRHLARVARSRHYTLPGRLETAYTLTQPLLYPLLMALTALFLARPLPLTHAVLGPTPQGWEPLVLLLAPSLLCAVPFLVWALFYGASRFPGRSPFASLHRGVLLWLYAYYVFPIALRALGRTLRGRTGWAKTRRNAESTLSGPVATEH